VWIGLVSKVSKSFNSSEKKKFAVDFCVAVIAAPRVTTFG
jgi:hypothetical protein